MNTQYIVVKSVSSPETYLAEEAKVVECPKPTKVLFLVDSSLSGKSISLEQIKSNREKSKEQVTVENRNIRPGTRIVSPQVDELIRNLGAAIQDVDIARVNTCLSQHEALKRQQVAGIQIVPVPLLLFAGLVLDNPRFEEHVMLENSTSENPYKNDSVGCASALYFRSQTDEYLLHMENLLHDTTFSKLGVNISGLSQSERKQFAIVGICWSGPYMTDKLRLKLLDRVSSSKFHVAKSIASLRALINTGRYEEAMSISQALTGHPVKFVRQCGKASYNEARMMRDIRNGPP